MPAIALFFAASLSASMSGDATPSCPPRESLGELGCAAVVSARTDVPRGPIDLLVNPGMARTADGYWLRWTFQASNGRAVGVGAFERVAKDGDLSGWNVPTVFRKVDVPETLVGERGCRVMGAVLAAGRRLGAWNCESTPGTILATPAPGATYRVLARLPDYYQAIVSTPVEHGEGSRVTLVSYDQEGQTFRLLDLGWR